MMKTNCLLTTSEVAQLTGYKRAYIRELLIQGAKDSGDPSLLHGQKHGRDWVVMQVEVDRFRSESGRPGPHR